MFTTTCDCTLTSNTLTQLSGEHGWPLSVDYSGPDTPATALSKVYHDFKAGIQKLVNENADGQAIREFVNGPAANQPELQPIVSALTRIIDGEDLFVERPWVGVVGYYWVHRDCEYPAIMERMSLQERDILKGMKPSSYDLINLQHLLTGYWEKQQNRLSYYKSAASHLLQCELGFDAVKGKVAQEEEASRAKGTARHMLHRVSARMSTSPKRTIPTPSEWDRMTAEIGYAKMCDQRALEFFAKEGMVMLGLLKQLVVDPLSTPGTEVNQVPQLCIEPRIHNSRCKQWQIPEKFRCNLSDFRDGEGFKGFSPK